MNYKSSNELSYNEMYDILISLGMTEEELDLAIKLNGRTRETFTDILYAKFGLRDFDQIDN